MQLDLNVEVINQNIFNLTKNITSDVFVARAFKPLKIILELMHTNSGKWKKVFIFLGKTGNDELLQASKSWNIEYKKRISITSSDSIIIEISKLEKKIN